MDTAGGVNNSTSNIGNFINNQYIKSTAIVTILIIQRKKKERRRWREVLKQIHQELVAIRKELQAVQIDLEHIRKHPFNVVTSLGHSSSYDTGEVNQKSGQLEIEELMSAIDEELDNCIKKFRNATRGNEVRTFITEYEELMLKKSDLVVKGFLKNERRTR